MYVVSNYLKCVFAPQKLTRTHKVFHKHLAKKPARQSSCGKPWEAYSPHRNLSKHNLFWLVGGGGSTPVLLRLGRYCSPALAGGNPAGTGLPLPGTGVLPTLLGVPSPGTQVLPGRVLGPVTGLPPERTWDQWKYYGMEMGYLFPPPPPRCELTNWKHYLRILRMRAVKITKLTRCLLIINDVTLSVWKELILHPLTSHQMATLQ